MTATAPDGPTADIRDFARMWRDMEPFDDVDPMCGLLRHFHDGCMLAKEYDDKSGDPEYDAKCREALDGFRTAYHRLRRILNSDD